jgi:hypothetical protein
MIDEPRLITECYCDALLVKHIGYSPTETHSGVGHIAHLLKTKFRNKHAVCVIDDDKKKQAYFDDFTEVHFAKKGGTKFLIKPNTKHIAIVIIPGLEAWLLDSAQKTNLSLKKIGLPNDIERLKSVTKDLYAAENPKLNRFLNELKQNRSNTNFNALKTHIQKALNYPFGKNKK